MASATLEGHDLRVGGLLHWLSVQNPAVVLVLRAGQGALEQRLSSVDGLQILQTLDYVDGLGCGGHNARGRRVDVMGGFRGT